MCGVLATVTTINSHSLTSWHPYKAPKGNTVHLEENGRNFQIADA